MFRQKKTATLVFLIVIAMFSAISIAFVNAQTSPTNLIANWKFDEGSGVTAADSSENGNNGVLMGNPTWGAGKVAEGLHFNGLTDYVEAPDNGALNVPNFTIAAWICLDRDIDNTQVRIVSKQESAVNSYMLSLFGNGYDGSTGNQLVLSIGDGTSWVNFMSNSKLSANIWYHFAAIHEGATSKLYIDGQLNKEGTTTTQTTNINAPMTIGCSNDPNYPRDFFFPGIIDEVQIYSRALNGNEIVSIFNENNTNTLAPSFFPSLSPNPTIETTSPTPSGDVYANEDELVVALVIGIPALFAALAIICGFVIIRNQRIKSKALKLYRQESNRCVTCGYQNTAGYTFCGKCGTKLASIRLIRPKRLRAVLSSLIIAGIIVFIVISASVIATSGAVYSDDDKCDICGYTADYVINRIITANGQISNESIVNEFCFPHALLWSIGNPLTEGTMQLGQIILILIFMTCFFALYSQFESKVYKTYVKAAKKLGLVSYKPSNDTVKTPAASSKTEISSHTKMSAKSRKILYSLLTLVIVISLIVGVVISSGFHISEGPTRPSPTTSMNISSLHYSYEKDYKASLNSPNSQTVPMRESYTIDAKNIGTSDLMIRVEIHIPQQEGTKIINGQQQKAWQSINSTHWRELGDSLFDFSYYMDVWNSTINAHIDKLSTWKGGDITFSSQRLYDITLNPELPDSLFQPDNIIVKPW